MRRFSIGLFLVACLCLSCEEEPPTEIHEHKLQPPELITPTQGMITNDHTPTFDWSDVPGTENYQLFADNNSDFTSLEVNHRSYGSSEHTPVAALPDGHYSWKVRGHTSLGDSSDWTEVWVFDVVSYEMGTVTDINGNVYRTIKIGSQWWMAENLKVTSYRNGDTIPNITDDDSWMNLTFGAYCNYNNDTTNMSAYGRLYNWFAVNDSRYLAPSGWHISSNSEWETLVTTLGGAAIAGGKMKEAGTSHWLDPNTGATNECGFSALPGGLRWAFNQHFLDMGVVAFFWTSSQDGSYAWSRHISYNDSEVGSLSKSAADGFSVRCVKN